MPTTKQLVYPIYILLITSLLSACGGGGGDGGGTRNIGPSISNTSPSTIDERTEATLSVSASDPDGSIREIRWLQQQGPRVAFTQSNNTITFTAPEVTEDTELLFSVDAVDDFGAISSVNIIVTVININRAPEAQDAQYNVNVNSSVTFNLMASDPDGDSLNYTITTQPGNGTLTLLDSATQQYSYEPDTDSLTPDSIEFEVSDGDLTDSATINFTVINTAKSSVMISGISAVSSIFDNHWIEITNISDQTVNLIDYQFKAAGIDISENTLKQFQASFNETELMAGVTVRYYFNVFGIDWLASENPMAERMTSSDSNVMPYWFNNGYIELLSSDNVNSYEMIHFGINDSKATNVSVLTTSYIPMITNQSVWQFYRSNLSTSWTPSE